MTGVTLHPEFLVAVREFLVMERNRQWCEYARRGLQSPWLRVAYDVRTQLPVVL